MQLNYGPLRMASCTTDALRIEKLHAYPDIYSIGVYNAC